MSLLERKIVEQCSPTLAGLKTGNLFSIRNMRRDQLRKEITLLNKKLRAKGLLFLPLRLQDDFALLYLYRPKFLAKDLTCPKARKILSECGYSICDPTRCLVHLMQKLSSGESSFPHEIGLFLGYPPEDVEGFIKDPDKPCRLRCKGCWKVYSHPEQAEVLFQKYRSCTSLYMKQMNRGSSLEQLIVSGCK